MYGLLADLIAAIHTLFVLFVVGGQILILTGWLQGWSWTRHRWFRILHLTAISFVVVEVLFGLWCPLTTWENSLRELAGQQGYTLSFIGYWLDRLLYYNAPQWVFDVAYTLFGLLVAITFRYYPPDKRTHANSQNGGSNVTGSNRS